MHKVHSGCAQVETVAIAEDHTKHFWAVWLAATLYSLLAANHKTNYEKKRKARSENKQTGRGDVNLRMHTHWTQVQ
jgi:hypothetical protein